MTTITFKTQPIHTLGVLPSVGSVAPDFAATNAALEDVSLSHFRGQRVVLTIFPSLDTGTCAASVVAFNAFAATKKEVVVLCLSMDLPFAQKRFCDQSHIDNVMTLSLFRSPNFGKLYGVTITDSPLRGLFARAVLVLDGDGRVMYTEQVAEITHEPNYDAVKKVLG